MATPSIFSRQPLTSCNLSTWLLICLGSLPLPLAAETVERIERTLDVQPGGKLVVEIASGQIDVTTSAAPTVSLDLERKVRASSKEKEEEFLADHPVTIEQEGNTVRIREKKRKKTWSLWRGLWGGGTKVSTRCTLVVPTEFNVDLDTSGGSISVAGLTGEARADTSGGSIRCENITGEVDADTSGGSITFVSVHGKARADTSGGGITVESGSGRLSLDTSGGSIRVSRHQGDVDADTSGGSITLDDISGNVSADTSGGSIRASLLAAPTGDCRLSTSGGGITVSMPGDARVDLDAATSGGRVESEFELPDVESSKKRNSIRGAINGGGPQLHLRTSGGGIRVQRLARST